MKKIFFSTVLMMILTVGAYGQTKAPVDQSHKADEASQKEFEAAVVATQAAANAFATAQAQYEAANAKLMAAILRALARAKLSPDEYKAEIKEGKLTFVQIPPDEKKKK
jgi:hypothetical protein